MDGVGHYCCLYCFARGHVKLDGGGGGVDKNGDIRFT
jgi:hypothetical protein